MVAEVVADHRLLSPAEFAAVGLPLRPLPFDSCLCLEVKSIRSILFYFILDFAVSWISMSWSNYLLKRQEECFSFGFLKYIITV